MRNMERFIFGGAAAVLIGFVVGGVLFSKSEAQGDIYENLTNFREVLHLVNSSYVEEVDLEALMEGAYQGMMESLDPYSAYLDPTEYARYLRGLPPVQGSTGLTVSKRYIYAVVVAVMPGSPAARAGLVPGDLIRAINGSHVREMNLLQVQRMIAGEVGTEISLSVVYQRNAERDELTLTREAAAPPTIPSFDFPDRIRYLKLNEITAGTAARLAQSLPGEGDDPAAGPRGLILDLRNNPGSQLEEAVKISDLFLSSGTVVTVEGRDGVLERYEAGSERTRHTGRLAVIIDRGTANAAEVVAAALQANDRAILIGEETFGQGSVQQAIPLSNGGAVLLSVARFYSPAGIAFQEKRVTPDLEVELEWNEALPVVPLELSARLMSEDPFIRRALEALHSEETAGESETAAADPRS